MNVLDVARYFINHSTPNSQNSITHLKLQKLTYFAHAWYLAVVGEPLVTDDEPEAWVHGPVFPKLYYRYRHYGFKEIVEERVAINFPKNVEIILEAVWNYYGDKTGKQLEVLSHQEMPWIKAREHLGKHDYCQTPINPEDIKKFYRETILF
ncbi:Panacea domain-containing protein [Paenibacillus senegalensis]|uniref:Panacea domain-containing protein n=1 Tax=Paenibacillus senegalensis TaxID=1465766 RepID=UPI0002898264|nr:type II toxin-antitoxin system antitoxin SocA domain-containing protein [Paenibacillus senegalensis]